MELFGENILRFNNSVGLLATIARVSQDEKLNVPTINYRFYVIIRGIIFDMKIYAYRVLAISGRTNKISVSFNIS